MTKMFLVLFLLPAHQHTTAEWICDSPLLPLFHTSLLLLSFPLTRSTVFPGCNTTYQRSYSHGSFTSHSYLHSMEVFLMACNPPILEKFKSKNKFTTCAMDKAKGHFSAKSQVLRQKVSFYSPVHP